jgi:hypothetical protein
MGGNWIEASVRLVVPFGVMAYTIDWIGTVALGVLTEGGRPLAFSLVDGQEVPSEFKEGDEVEIRNHPEHPAVLAMGMENEGYYEITHVKSRVMLRLRHSADMYKVE